MKIPMAFLADEANISQEGKLNVLGIFDRIAAAEFPVVHPRMVFAFRVQADFGDGGVAFMAQPQIPPRNINWSASGKWVHTAKAAFEGYFLHKVRSGQAEPLYEKLALDLIGAHKLRRPA